MEMIRKGTVSTDKLDALADKFKELTGKNKKFTLDEMIDAEVIGGDNGKPIQVSNEMEMSALLVEKNIGNIYLYTGETSENFINGQIYVVVEV
jgi:hypothetical protein